MLTDGRSDGQTEIWTPISHPAISRVDKNRGTIQCYTQNIYVLGLVVLEKKIFLCFSHCTVSLWELMTPGARPFLTPGAWLAGFIKRTTTHCYIQNMKALGLVFSEKKIFLCFTHDPPGAEPVWTPGARLAGFIKTTTIHCYTQNMKTLGLVVLEQKIFFYVFPIVSLWELMTTRARPFLTPEAWLAGFIKRTNTHCYIQNINALGLVVSEKKIFLCFTHDAPGAWPV